MEGIGMALNMNMKALAVRSIHRASSFRLYGPKRKWCRTFSVMSPPSTAVVYEEQGEPDKVTRLVEMPGVKVKPNEVCVKMLAAPINPSDINRIQGVYPVRPQPPAIGGYEGVGQIYCVGSSVRSLNPGDLVIPSPPSFGTWQSYIVKDESVWHKIHKHTPIEYAATVTVNPLSAFRMLQDFVQLTPGDAIVQNGATSIVGQCLIQLAHIQGLRSINIIRDRAAADQVKDHLTKLGADQVFTESQLEVKNIKDMLGSLSEPALGFNCVGGKSATLVLRLLRNGGTMVTYGGMSKNPVTVSTSSFIFKDLSLKGFWLQKWMNTDRVHECRNTIDLLLGMMRDGKLKYDMELVPFKDFHSALDKALGKQGTQPKQVLIF